MSWTAFHFAGGDAFFTGSALMMLAFIAALWRRKSSLRRWEPVVSLVGMGIVALSATPLPLWFYAGWGGTAIAWLIVLSRAKQPGGQFSVAVMSALLIVVTVLGVAWELTYRFPPRLQPATH